MNLKEKIVNRTNSAFDILTRTAYAAMFSLAINSTAVAYTHDEINSSDPAIEEKSNPSNENKNLESKLSKVPTIQVNLEESSLIPTLGKINQSFTGEYLICEGPCEEGRTTEAENGRIEIKFKDKDAKKNTYIEVYNNNKLIDIIDFSDIKNIQWAQNQNGKSIDYHVLVKTNSEVNNNGLSGYEIKFYDLIIKDNPELIASYLLALARDYSENDKQINEQTNFCVNNNIKKNDNKEDKKCEEKECSEPIYPISINPIMIKEVCSGKARESIDGYKIDFVGRVNYDECKYNPKDNPKDNSEELSQLLQKMVELKDKAYGTFIFCGNADEKSAKQCPKEVDENFKLSYHRADSLVSYLQELISSKIESSLIIHPNGTTLNEKSVRVYYISKDKEVK